MQHGGILTIFIAPIAGFAIPLLPIHILWINLVTDGLPELAIVTEEPEENIINRTQRPPKEIFFAVELVLKYYYLELSLPAYPFSFNGGHLWKVMIKLYNKQWYLQLCVLYN